MSPHLKNLQLCYKDNSIQVIETSKDPSENFNDHKFRWSLFTKIQYIMEEFGAINTYKQVDSYLRKKGYPNRPEYAPSLFVYSYQNSTISAEYSPFQSPPFAKQSIENKTFGVNIPYISVEIVQPNKSTDLLLSKMIDSLSTKELKLFKEN